jgi:AbrB family looped-hinge helix DNA binding protein
MRPTVSQMSTKGQVVIPARLREELGLAPGTQLTVEREGNAIILRPLTPAYIRSLRGYFRNSSLGELRDREHRKDKR